jgi:pilus assembly protein CpaD
MHANRSLLVLALALFVGACAPATTYTDAEAPKRLKLDSATTQVELHFAPGTASLSPADAAHLRQLAATGGIGPSDRVTVAAAGPPHLAEERVGSVSTLLLHYGVVAIAEPVDVPPNRAVVEVTRTLVTLPPCPNWSKTSGMDYGNQPSSNFGCATATNLGMMIANPTDLASGLPVGASDGHPASAAVNRYVNDKVELPSANTALPVAAAGASPTSGGNANASSPTGTGSGSGGS